jgi:hypothetical protein
VSTPLPDTWRRSRAWIAGIAGAAALIMAVPWIQPMAARGASPATTSAPATDQVMATGPFGSVAGIRLDPAAGAPAAEGLEALDAWARGASIVITARDGSLDGWRLSVIQEPVLPGAVPIDLGDGQGTATVRLPAAGLFLLRLDARIGGPAAPGGPGADGSWLWRIAVPDRDLPGGGDPYPPVPAIMLVAADDAVALDPGSGCFVGTCGDIGATAPPRTLPTIRTRAGAPLSVHLADLSNITEWTAQATPIGGTDDQTVQLGSGLGGTSPGWTTFAAPAAGRWVILVHVRFDRGRGSFDGYGRLILGPPDPLRAISPGG